MNSLIPKIVISLEAILLVALITAFSVLLLDKTGLRAKVVIYGSRLLSELFSCDFCLCFWIGLVFSFIIFLHSRELTDFLIPIFSTPLSRKLI